MDQVYGFTQQLVAVSAIGQDILQITSIASKLALALLLLRSASATEDPNPIQAFYQWIHINRFFLLVITLEQEFWLEWLAQLKVNDVHCSQYAMSYNWHPVDAAKVTDCDTCGANSIPLAQRQWPQDNNPAVLRNVVNAALSNLPK
jgi:hypothetical protein